MRKVLTYSELREEYDGLFEGDRISTTPKNEKKSLWLEMIDTKYPDLKPCPICGSSNYIDYYEGYVGGSVWDVSFPYIECEECNLKLTGTNRNREGLIENWNGMVKVYVEII